MVLRNASNLGYGSGCNRGARGSDADLLLFLNPDVVVNNETISTCIRFLEDPANASVGIVGPQLVDSSGSVQRTCSRLPTRRSLVVRTLGLDRLSPTLFDGSLMTECDHSQTRDVGQVMGAFMLVRRSVFEKMGGFDETFFLYYEDVDLCARTWAAGQRVTYLADARAQHIGLVSSSQVPGKRLSYSFSSRKSYGRKHFGEGFAILLAVLMVVGEAPIRSVVAVLRGQMRDAVDTWRAVGRFIEAKPVKATR